MTNKPNKQKQNRLILIKRYTFVAVNLYGVIKLDDFIQVFNHYEKEVLSSIDLIDVSFKEDILANGYFYMTDGKDVRRAKVLLDIQSNKPRYLPTKDEFLKYEDDDYVEPMKPLTDLEKFIKANQLVVVRRPDDIMSDVLEIHDQIVMGATTSHYMGYINRRGYEFKDEIQIKLFMGLVMNLHNNTRLYDNCGHTPLEIRETL
ncbi:MAG: hypothetical protein RBQ95_07510 [Paracholeplasma sp.]|nr:hypothetical protein [Paracholeplasma sp.]MDY3196692.1 hypothetical protein [Paracholeplasma sp.]